MVDKNRFISNSLTYFIFSIISQILNFLLIPIYTRNISVNDFGQYNLVNSIQSLLSIFITLGIYSGLMRFINEQEDKNNLKNIALTFSIMWGMLCIIVGFISAPLLAKLLFKEDNLGTYYIKYIVINSVMLCIISIYTSYLSMQFKAMKSSLIEVMKMFLLLLITYYYIVITKTGILGIFKSQFLCYLIIMSVLLFIDSNNIKLLIEKSKLKTMLGYGLGLVPGQISSWVLTLVDRYFIKVMINLSSVGIYSMGYKIGMIIQPVFLTPFQNAFTPFKFNAYKEKNAKQRIREIYNYFNFIGWFVILGLSVFAEIAIRVFSTPDYIGAYLLVPIIAFSYYLWGMGSFYCLGLHIANKMLLNSMIATFAAIVNVIFNFILIPYMGIYGAAISTVISYIVANLFYYYFGKRYYDLNINLFEPFKYGFVFLCVYLVYYFIRKIALSLWIQFFICLGLCALYILACFGLELVSYSKTKDMLLSLKYKFLERHGNRGEQIEAK